MGEAKRASVWESFFSIRTALSKLWLRSWDTQTKNVKAVRSSTIVSIITVLCLLHGLILS
jgi:hypothetical protein